MKLPFYSQSDIWANLTSDSLGFYDYKTKSKIPNRSGVYAWYLPIKLMDNPNESIRRVREVNLYDSASKGPASFEESIYSQWEYTDLSISKSSNHKVESTIDRYWEYLVSLSKSNKEEMKSIRQQLLMATLFSRPLYIGLAKNFYVRYEQHLTGQKVNGYEKNTFNKRFEAYTKEIGLNVRVRDLLFVTLTLPSDQGEEAEKSKRVVFEYMLKNICNPIFSER